MSLRMLGGQVAFTVPPEVAFDYLVDPRHRPDWQSSLRRVDDVTGEPALGQTWTDVTVPGLKPRMRTTELERPGLWSESGTWGPVTAHLTLRFAASGAGCTVGYRFRITGPGPLAPLGLALTAAALPAVRSDVRRAARLLAG